MRNHLLAALLVSAAFVPGCGSTYKTETEGAKTLSDEVQETITSFKNRDPGVQRFFDNAYGYAVFPSIGKGAVGVGGAHGEGEVYERGRFIGRTTMSQGTVGFALGGQVYSELIFFKDEPALVVFKGGNMEFSGNASAVAARAGAAAAADYESGVAVFVMPKAGLMFEASIGGQKFEFIPKP